MKQKLSGLLHTLRANDKLWQLMAALLGTYGCLYLLGLAGVELPFFTGLGLPILIAVYCLLARTKDNLSKLTDSKQRRRRVRYAFIVAYLFSLTMIMGYQLQTRGITDYGFKGKGMILIRALFMCIAIFPFGNMLFHLIERIGSFRVREGKKKPWKSGAVMGISAAVIFVCLIPVWLAYYPLVMSYDFHRQVNEAAKGFIWFVPYQPLAHTWIIWCFLQLGYLWGDVPAGFSAMSMLQMILYALVTGYSCAFIYRITKKKWAVVAAALFFGVLPLNSVMVMCSTKDVLFSILFLLFHLLMAERFFFSKGKKQIVMDVLMVVVGCLMIQLRNNCIYAVAVYGILWFVFSARKEKLRVLLICVALVAGGKGLSVVIKEALGTEISDNMQKVEKYSVPASQFGRIGYMYGDTLDPETWELLDRYLPYEAWSGYLPHIADRTKSSIRLNETWEGHTLQLIKDWAAIGVDYPNEYIDAFLELTRGYWFLDDRSYAECLGWGVEGRMGLLYTYNSSEIEDQGEIEHVSKFPWLEEQLEKVVSGNTFYNWPLVSLLFKAAFYFWGLCLVFVAYLYLRQRKQVLMCAFPLLYMATMLLGPVVQIRYVFPAMVVLPMLIGLLFLRGEDREVKN